MNNTAMFAFFNALIDVLANWEVEIGSCSRCPQKDEEHCEAECHEELCRAIWHKLQVEGISVGVASLDAESEKEGDKSAGDTLIRLSPETVTLMKARRALLKEGLHEDSVEQDNVMYDLEKLLQRLVLKEAMEHLDENRSGTIRAEGGKN